MNNKETATNGASLEDCRTNVFPLTDARGLQWRKYTVVSGVTISRISEDPILISYSNAIRQGILCTWQRRTTNNSIKEEFDSKLVEWTKELVIFWFGDEPKFSGIVCPTLREKENGCFEDGISNEYQSLLFKSLHNQLERQLLSEKFFCNGRWFTKSCKKGCDWETLAFSFNIFIYGESLVVASVDIQKQTTLRCLSRSDLSDATSGDSVPVILTPAGLNAVLTGYSLPSSDARATRILKEWEKFYPVLKDEKSNGFIPCLVEIVHSDNKMLYPSCLIGVPVNRPGKKLADCTSRNEANSTEGKANCVTCSRKAFAPIPAMTNRVWSNIEQKTENKKSSVATKPEAAPVFGPNMPLWDFKDKARSIGCGCTSSTNVNRSKPLGKFGSSVSGMKSSHVGVNSPSTNVPGSNQASGVNQKGRKERKKTSLPFHQRRATNTERSPTPPITLPSNLKSINIGVAQGTVLPSSVELTGDVHSQSTIASRQSPAPQNASIKLSIDGKCLDQSYNSVQLQNISPIKALHHRNRIVEKSKKYKSKVSMNRTPIDYTLPTNMVPRRPALSGDTLEGRSLLTDKAFSSLYEATKIEKDYAVSEVLSPTPMQISNVKQGEAMRDGEVMIVRMPNKGIKRTTDEAQDDGTKKAKLTSHTHPQPQSQPQQQPQHSYNAATPPPQSPAQSHLISQQDGQFYSQPSNGCTSQLTSHMQPHNQQPTVAPKRGPGRPKKQSASQSALYSPKTEQNILENGSILSPPSGDKRRRQSSQSTKIKEESLSSPPSVPGIKAAPVKGRRRPSKKDSSFSDNEMPPALSPSPYLPSPARTPGSTSGVSFTQSKDLTVNFSDLDKLFEPSDDEDEMETKNKQINTNTTGDMHTNPRVSANDDIFRTNLPPPTTTLPHDLSEMFPTPPSQDAPPPATSPATSLPGDYVNSTSFTHCHAVMSPEKHVGTYEKRFDENCTSDLREGLESPFVVPERQDFPVDDIFTPLPVLPSMKRKGLKIKNLESMKYKPSWKSVFRNTVNYQDKAANLIKLSISTYDSLRRVPVKKTMPCLTPAIVNNANKAIAGKRIPENGKQLLEDENVERKPLLSGDLTNQPLPQKEALIEPVNDMEDTHSLEVTLVCKGPDPENGLRTDIWPHDQLFKNDKSLTQSHVDDEPDIVFKEPRPKRPEVLDLTISNDIVPKNTDNKQQFTRLPSRIAELFKEQWLSPFSVLNVTRMLSQFYHVDFKSNSLQDLTATSAVDLLYELNNTIQNAFKQPLKRRSRELQKLEGPVSFSSLHKISGKNTFQSNLPVHPILIGADGDYVSVAPNSLKSWTKLFLEPFSGRRDVAYVVVAPDSDLVLENTKQFFKELSITYESMNMGKHGPIIRVLREGIIRVKLKVMQNLANETVDEWFSQDESAESIRMKLIAQVCKALLGPHLASLELNRTLFDKSPAEEKHSGESVKPKVPGANANSISGLTGVSTLGLVHEDADNGSSNNDLPAIVVYMIDPFQVTGVSTSKEPLWSLNGLIRAFAEMTSGFPDALKNNVFLQVVPLESILQFKASTKYHNGIGLNPMDMQHLALSVYSSCRVTINSLHSGKICTGFGPGSLRDKLTKKRQIDQQFPTRVFVPPFILAPQISLIKEDPHTPSDLARLMNTSDGNILFCSYCLSHDHSYVLVTCTDRRGEIADTTIIKIHPQSRQTQESRSPRKLALRRVLYFALDVVSFFFEAWRIVIHRLGKPGKGELKDLYDLSRKLLSPTLPKKRPPTPESCAGCRATNEEKQRPAVGSITVATLQLESLVKIIPNNNKTKSNSGSRIFVSPVVSQSAKRKDKRITGQGLLSLPFSQHDDLISDPVFLMPNQDDDENFMGLLASPAEVSTSSLLTSPQSDLVQPVFSPGDVMHAGSISAMSPFQPIVQNSPAFSTALSPLPIMSRPSSTQAGKINIADDFSKISRQPLCTGYILSDSSSVGDGRGSPSLIKSDLLFHLTKNDTQISKQPLDSDNYLELHRFILEQLDGLSWLTIDTATGKRHSALASHIYLLTRFYETFSYFVT